MSSVARTVKSYEPFASCATDAAIFYALEEKGDSWWNRNVWHFVSLSNQSPCALWRGAVEANRNESGRSLPVPIVDLKIAGDTGYVGMKVRRLLYAWAYGYEELPDGRQVQFSTDEVIAMTCWNNLCVRPGHMEKVSRMELGKRAWLRETELVVG